MRNIYKWWVKKNPVKILNTVYTIVIQQSEIVKNQAQLQKYLAVPDIVYTLAWFENVQNGWSWRGKDGKDNNHSVVWQIVTI